MSSLLFRYKDSFLLLWNVSYSWHEATWTNFHIFIAPIWKYLSIWIIQFLYNSSKFPWNLWELSSFNFLVNFYQIWQEDRICIVGYQILIQRLPFYYWRNFAKRKNINRNMKWFSKKIGKVISLSSQKCRTMIEWYVLDI